MSEIKDKNQLVIKNSATIELERRKGFVNILLQGNPNLYRAWVERNNKIVIDISGESTEYNLDTQTPDYIEILKDQTNNKYYINFTGSITGEGSLVSDDITFSQEGDNTRLTIKSSKFVSTSKIQSGTSDYLYVNVDESGNVRVGFTQEAIEKINSVTNGLVLDLIDEGTRDVTSDDATNYLFGDTANASGLVLLSDALSNNRRATVYSLGKTFNELLDSKVIALNENGENLFGDDRTCMNLSSCEYTSKYLNTMAYTAIFFRSSMLSNGTIETKYMIFTASSPDIVMKSYLVVVV